jgi:transposase
MTLAVSAIGTDDSYLPPYSPDLNPIENAFSKLKRGLRDFAACTTTGVCQALRELVNLFDPAECLNCF